MRGTHTRLFVHLVWATWDRAPLLTGALRDRVYACIMAECERLRAEVLALGGVEDHVHLLVRMPPAISVSDLAKQVKGASSHFATHEIVGRDNFKWQGAYAAFTLGEQDLETVRAYILNQEAHHHHGSTDAGYEFE